MRSLSPAHWLFHALCCLAVGLISHNAYETKSLNPPPQNALVCAVSSVAHSGVVHSVADWTWDLMNSMVRRLEPYHAPRPSPARHAHRSVARARTVRVR